MRKALVFVMMIVVLFSVAPVNAGEDIWQLPAPIIKRLTTPNNTLAGTVFRYGAYVLLFDSLIENKGILLVDTTGEFAEFGYQQYGPFVYIWNRWWVKFGNQLILLNDTSLVLEQE